MNSTRSSLLHRVRDFKDDGAWETFDQLYRPLLVRYARHHGIADQDAEEIAQQSLDVIVRSIRDFERRKSFRAWLKRVVDNKVKQHLRMRQRAAFIDPHVLEAVELGEQPAEELWDRQWTRTHLLYCLAAVREDFKPHTVQAFELYVLQEMPVGEICRILGMTPNQIYVGKNRVVRRIRERFAALMHRLYGEGPPVEETDRLPDLTA